MGYEERAKKQQLIDTIHGPIEASRLTKKTYDGVVEYYLNGELVHRSATLQLQGVEATGEAHKF